MERKIIAVVGPRDLTRLSETDLISAIETIKESCVLRFGENGFEFTTISCDKGFGKLLKEFSVLNKIRLVEFLTYFHADREDKFNQEEFFTYLQARHAALLDISHEFHIIRPDGKKLVTTDDLVDRLRGFSQGADFYVLDAKAVLKDYRQQYLPMAYGLPQEANA